MVLQAQKQARLAELKRREMLICSDDVEKGEVAGPINNPNDPSNDHFFRSSWLPKEGQTYNVTLAWDASRNVFTIDFAGAWRGEIQTSSAVNWGSTITLGSANVDKKGWASTAGNIDSISVR